MSKFLALLHVVLCIVASYGFWYLAIWFFTNQIDPFEWAMRVKIFYFIFGMISSESLRAAEIKIQVKRKKDE
jgi:hypothetical protein